MSYRLINTTDYEYVVVLVSATTLPVLDPLVLSVRML
jgi:hypothetical protein